MRSFWLNKLVKDKIFQSMQRLGQQVHYRKLDDEEFVKALREKLLEEVKEFDPSKPNASEELADILEAVEQLGKQLGKNFSDLRKLQADKRKEWGSFKERIYVEYLELSDDDPWVKYYAADPERFPEKK